MSVGVDAEWSACDASVDSVSYESVVWSEEHENEASVMTVRYGLACVNCWSMSLETNVSSW